ncbi:hypothetical protein [Microbacterium sp.]|uniref:hypothetical protein n=1 Tax=Microbacterium sp. TaxID=51671 RepID=UPI0037CBD4C1
MSDAPFESSRRSRREQRAAVDGPTTEQLLGLDASHATDERPAASDGSAAVHDRPEPLDRSAKGSGDRGPSSFVGTWKPLVAAAAALVVATIVGLLVTVGFDGAAGRSLGGLLASIVLGGTGIALMARTRPAGFFALRGLDVLWALVLGALLPFVTGVWAGSLGFPALAALSPRWLVLGVATPFAVTFMLTFFAIGFVYPAALGYVAKRLSSTVARIVAGVVSAAAFAIIPVVFAGTVSGMPMALLVGLGIAASVFVGLSGRFWGPLLMGIVFTGVWVAMSVAGYILA